MFCSIFRENIRFILHEVTKEDEQYVIIMPDYSVEEATKITKGYSIVNSRNSSAVTKSRVDLSHQDHDHCSKSMMFLFPVVLNKFSSNGKANINLNKNSKEVLKSKETNRNMKKFATFVEKYFTIL